MLGPLLREAKELRTGKSKGGAREQGLVWKTRAWKLPTPTVPGPPVFADETEMKHLVADSSTS